MAEVRIYNPDGSEAELSGNGVRQAVMYLHRAGWTEHDSFSVRTAAGEIRPRIRGELCTMDMGRAAARPRTSPAGRRRLGHAHRGGPEFSFQFVRPGIPNARSRMEDGLEELDLSRYGPEIERHELFPNRTNVSFWRSTAADRIRARIFERGVGETMASAPVPRAPRWQRCCAGWTAR